MVDAEIINPCPLNGLCKNEEIQGLSWRINKNPKRYGNYTVESFFRLKHHDLRFYTIKFLFKPSLNVPDRIFVSSGDHPFNSVLRYLGLRKKDEL